MEKWLPAGWLALTAVLVVVELATPQLVSIWFALGAAAAALVSLTDVPPAVQLAVFVLVSCVALILSRPLARRMLERRTVHTNADAVVGSEGVVTEAVDNLKSAGRVLAGGLSWSARAEADASIAVGTAVRVLRIEGVKLIVEPAAGQDVPAQE